MNAHFGRRGFLMALGAGLTSLTVGSAASTPSPSTSPTAALGRSRRTGQPLRFIGVYTPHGIAHEHYLPRDDFDFSYEHAVLAAFDDEKTYGKRYKSSLTLLDGVDLTAGIEVGTVGHDAPRVILTGSGAGGKNASIDQFLAVEHGLGADTLHTSLVLAVGSDDSGLGFNVSYAAGGTPLPKQIDPRALFDDLFGGPLTGKGAAQLDADRQLGRSVLDFLSSDLERLRRQSPASERVKLEQHQTALREIEKRLTRTAPACDAPARPREFARLRSFGGGEADFDEITNLMIDLSARALACDLTRFSTLFLADLSRTGLDASLPNDVHTEVAHLYLARSARNPGRPETWNALARQNRYTYGKLARLAQRLDEAGILGDSVVYASSDMGDPARHSSRRVPTLLIGDAGGAFQSGRVHDFPDALPNNRVLVSLCQAFGVEVERFGTSPSSSTVTGRLDALHA